MNVLLCGASGITGRELGALLTKHQIPWTGTYNTNPFPNGRKADFTNATDIESIFQSINPTICVNCIVERKVETCEKEWEKTKQLNIDIPQLLAGLCKKYNVYFIHISTDYVFDGLQGPYLPQSQPNPLQNYGISKLIAECRVQSIYPSSCIVRVPVLYSASIKTLSESAVTVLGKKVMDRLTPSKEDHYFPRRPVFIADLCEYLLDNMKAQRSGIHHFYNPKDRFTKYEIVEMISDILHKPTNHIAANAEKPLYLAGRPYDTHLLDPSYDRSQYAFTALRDGLQEVFQQFTHEPLSLYTTPTDPILFLIDLDGTLVDTDRLHYEAYAKVLQEYKIDLPWETYQTIVHLDEYLRMRLTPEDYLDAKQKKLQEMLNVRSVELMPGAEELLNYLERFSINYAVVTNTSRPTIQHFQTLCKPLQLIKQWVTREDVSNPKPDSECYKKAITLYGKDETCILGIENTLAGYESLRSVTSKIYILTQPNSYTHTLLQQHDCYFVSSLKDLFTNVER
jgi:HAD superfamily hydrolase (TIGR01509 family)